MKNVKLIYFLILVVCLLSSCSSDSPDVNLGRSDAMSFDVSDKSRATSTSNLTEFTVFGDMKFSPNSSADLSLVFHNTKVNYLNGKWDYGDTQYWFPLYEYSFVAVSPSSVLSSDNTPLYLNSNLSFRYSIPTSADDNPIDPADLTDIVVATHRRLYNSDDPGSTVVFRFGHIMSLINLAPALDDNSMGHDEYIKIHKLEFTGVKTNARLDITPASRLSGNRTDDMILDVTGIDDGNITLALSSPVRVDNDARNVSLFPDNDAIVMIPQAFATDSDSEIIVYYSVNEDPAMQQVTLPLKNLEWMSARSYYYRFTIEKNCANFGNCDINPWNLIEGDEISVN